MIYSGFYHQESYEMFKGESEVTAYIRAVDQALLEKDMPAVSAGKEGDLVEAMFDADRNHTDCVDAIIMYRNKGVVI